MSHLRRTVRDMLDGAPPVLNVRSRVEKLGVSVRCQTSNRMIGAQHERAPGFWVFPGYPGCSGGEGYSEVRDYRLAWIPKIFDRLHAMFGPSLGMANPTLVLEGEYAESALQPGCMHLIYLFRDSNGYQYAQQMAHECFHRWVTPTEVHHWTHEMLGEVFKVECIAELGMPGFVDQHVLPNAERDATRLSVEQFQVVPVRDNPEAVALYARALLTGLALQKVVGVSAFWRLASMFDDSGTPDINAWIRSLPPGDAAQASTILEFEIDLAESLVDLVNAENVTVPDVPATERTV